MAGDWRAPRLTGRSALGDSHRGGPENVLADAIAVADDPDDPPVLIRRCRRHRRRGGLAVTPPLPRTPAGDGIAEVPLGIPLREVVGLGAGLGEVGDVDALSGGGDGEGVGERALGEVVVVAERLAVGRDRDEAAVGGGGRDAIEQQLKAATGLDLQEDVIAWMGDFGVFVRGTEDFAGGTGKSRANQRPSVHERSLDQVKDEAPRPGFAYSPHLSTGRYSGIVATRYTQRYDQLPSA